jgi:uncharacterized membrane protein
MATKRAEIRREQRGAQGQTAPKRAAHPERAVTASSGRRARQGAGPGGEPNGGQQSSLLNVNAEQLARGLAWFSIGLGLAELLAPRAINKISGGRGQKTGFIRLLGLREIGHGIAIFAQGKKPAAAVWARVAGDALDLAVLGAAFAAPDTSKGRVAFATANVLTVGALDVICAQQLSTATNTNAEGGTQVRKTIIINRSPEELYQFWHDFENLPRFMTDLESVVVRDGKHSHWVAKAPAGTSVEWDAEITADEPNRLISWRSLEGADVDNSGTVRFEPATGGRGTVVIVEIEYNPPGGVVGATVAKLFGKEPGQQAQEALRCFKQLMETGEVVISEGTVWDNGLLTQRPAQPPTNEELAQTRAAGASQI